MGYLKHLRNLKLKSVFIKATDESEASEEEVENQLRKMDRV